MLAGNGWRARGTLEGERKQVTVLFADVVHWDFVVSALGDKLAKATGGSELVARSRR